MRGYSIKISRVEHLVAVRLPSGFPECDPVSKRLFGIEDKPSSDCWDENGCGHLKDI